MDRRQERRERAAARRHAVAESQFNRMHDQQKLARRVIEEAGERRVLEAIGRVRRRWRESKPQMGRWLAKVTNTQAMCYWEVVRDVYRELKRMDERRGLGGGDG